MASKLETQVMASVGTIYAARLLFGTTALKLYTCAAALTVLWKLVWITRVYENLLEVGVGGAFNFILAAVLNTDLLVQLMLLVLFVAGVSFVRDLVRTLQQAPRPAF